MEAEKSVTHSLIVEKESWRNTGNDKQEVVDFSFTQYNKSVPLLHNTKIHTNICTKFQNPRRSSSCEIFDINVIVYYNGVRDGKRKNGIRKQSLISDSFIFFTTIYMVALKYTKFEDSGSHRGL